MKVINHKYQQQVVFLVLGLPESMTTGGGCLVVLTFGTSFFIYPTNLSNASSTLNFSFADVYKYTIPNDSA